MLSFTDEADLGPDGSLILLAPKSVSCDREHLIYSRSIRTGGSGEDVRYDVRTVRILSTDPLVLGAPEPHSDYGREGSKILMVSESPDCAYVYLRSNYTQWYRQRVPCPPG